ncbi:MAG: tetratricopeptide repeat protein [Muribaculum sp.]|nr:tetratricopeptide repeat protein [Muribaculum sp.]
MASDKKIDTNEEQTTIENLNAHLTNAGQKLANNKKIVWWSLGIIAAVAVFTASYLFIYRNPRLQNSWEAYNKVLLQVQKGELTDSASATQYQQVAEQFSGTDAGACAALAAAEAFYDNGNFDAAIKNLEKFHSAEPVISTQAKVLLGDCFVNKNQLPQALEAFQDAIEKADGNPQLVPFILVKEANVYDAQKNYAKALECYETINAQYPEFTFSNGMTAEAYIAREKARLGK